jgi:AcrR family transcriptional regulator
MGSLPRDKAGVGSAMNDTTREIGGALGVAVLGSITNALYTSSITGNPNFATLQQAAPQLADAVKSSIGSAVVAAQTIGGSTAVAIQRVANQAFVHALSKTVIVGAFVALGGAAVAYFFLPARAATADTGDELVDAATDLLPIDSQERRNLALIVLDMLADAGLSSLTYNAIAAKSGISVSTLQANWPSRIDAVVDALGEIRRSRPIPDTGNLADDLSVYLRQLADVAVNERAREVLGALVVECAADPQLATALRERVVAPRRAELISRLQEEPTALRVPVDAAIDILTGPIYHRSMISNTPPDDVLVDAIIRCLLDRPADPAAGNRVLPGNDDVHR